MYIRIKELYELIPKSVCKPGCTKCCKDMIQFSLSEEIQMGGYDWNGQCNHICSDGCLIYEKRPFVCRLFGTSEMLRCEDCVPERYLSEEETIRLIHEYFVLREKDFSTRSEPCREERTEETKV